MKTKQENLSSKTPSIAPTEPAVGLNRSAELSSFPRSLLGKAIPTLEQRQQEYKAQLDRCENEYERDNVRELFGYARQLPTLDMFPPAAIRKS